MFAEYIPHCFLDPDRVGISQFIRMCIDSATVERDRFPSMNSKSLLKCACIEGYKTEVPNTRYNEGRFNGFQM